jgi:hypothetical protein
VLKEQLKLRLGMAPNANDVARFQRAGVWTDSLAEMPATVWVAAALRAGNAAVTGAFLLLSLLAGFWLVLADRGRLARPEVAVLLAALVACWGAVCAVAYQPRFTNLLYVLGAPIVLVALDGLRERVMERRQRRAAARPEPAGPAIASAYGYGGDGRAW